MLTLLLLIIVFIMLYINLVMSKGDFISPPFLMNAGFCASIFCASILGINNGISIGPETFICIIIGILSFSIGYYVINVGCIAKGNRKNKKIVSVYIKISNKRIIIYLLFSTIVCCLLVYEIISVMGMGISWTDTIQRYRWATMYSDSMGTTARISSTVAYLSMFVTAAGYVFIYVMCNNLVVCKKINWSLIVCIIVSNLPHLIRGSRSEIMQYFFAIIVCYLILKYLTGYISKTEKIKLVLRYIIVLFIAILAFNALRGMVGRSTSGGLVYYVSKYLGSSIFLLDKYFGNPIHSEIWGKETFWAVNNLMYSFTGNEKLNYDFALEFNDITSSIGGNVYTAFRMYYSDFYWPGVILLSILLGAIFGFLYACVRYNIRFKFPKIQFNGISLMKSSLAFNIWIAFYIKFIFGIIMMFYQDWFYSQMIGISSIKFFVTLWIMSLLILHQSKITEIATG